MYTQCSNCQTIFKLSAEVLRAAGGQVRCGRCGEVFSALARLAEDASAFSVTESPLELEQRADSILETTVVEDIPLPPLAQSPSVPGVPVEIAHLKLIDEDLEEVSIEIEPEEAAAEPEQADPHDISMEFTLPPGELDRIFVESKTGLVPPFPLGKLPISPPPPQAEEPPEAEPPAAAPPPPVRKAPQATKPRVASEPVARSEPPKVPEVERARAEPSEEEESEEDIPGIEILRDNRQGGGGVISEAVRRQVMATDDTPDFDLGGPKRATPRSLLLWGSLSLLLTLSLAAQVVHHNREWLASHGPMGPWLRSLYARVGTPVAVPANLSAYELRQWGVTGDPAADGTLKVRASILNTTAQLVPYPLLRVTLANRYGTRIGAREFEPSEYLGKPTARLIAPGERVDATVQIVDPGKDAEGFEIDVCLRAADKKLLCANDAAAPQAKS